MNGYGHCSECGVFTLLIQGMCAYDRQVEATREEDMDRAAEMAGDDDE